MAVIQELAVALNTSNAGFNKGLAAAEKRLKSFSNNVQRAGAAKGGGGGGRGLGAKGGILGAIGALGSAVIGKDVAENLDQYAKLSKRVGIAAKDLVKLDFATTFAGGSFSAMETTLFRFNKRVGEAVQGNKQWRSGYQAIGTTVEELQKQGGPFEQFVFVLGKINALASKGGLSLQTATAASQKIFGREGAEQALNLAQNYDAIAQAQRLIASQPSIVPSSEEFARAENIVDNFSRIGARLTGLKRSAFGAVSGVLEGVTGFLGGAQAGGPRQAEVEDPLTHDILQNILRTLQGTGAPTINVPRAQ